MTKDKTLGVREPEKRRTLIKKYVAKDKQTVSDVYRKLNDDIILHKGIPPYLMEGKDK